MINKSEISTDVAASSSAFDAEWSAHWNTAAMASEVRQFAIVRIVQKKTDDMREFLPTEMQSLPADFIAVNDLQWESVSLGELPREVLAKATKDALNTSELWEVLVFKGFLRVEYVFRGRKRVLWHNAATAKSFLIETRA